MSDLFDRENERSMGNDNRHGWNKKRPATFGNQPKGAPKSGKSKGCAVIVLAALSGIAVGAGAVVEAIVG